MVSVKDGYIQFRFLLVSSHSFPSRLHMWYTYHVLIFTEIMCEVLSPWFITSVAPTVILFAALQLTTSTLTTTNKLFQSDSSPTGTPII